MLEHLDDPQPFEPNDSFRRTAIRRGRSRKRRMTALALSPVVLIGGLGVGGALWVRAKLNDVDQVPVAGLTPITAPAAADPVESAPPDDGTTPTETLPIEEALATQPVNVLIVGVDTRPADDDVSGSRSDTIVVARVDPTTQQIRLLSIPRDLWIDSTNSRINALFDPADPSRLVDAISSDLGIDINHYVAVDFEAFKTLVDLAGGVAVPFDTPVRDDNTGLLIDTAGCHVLDGDQALAYVRSRHYEVWDEANGKWVQDPTSDIGRMARQQDFIARAYAAVLADEWSAADQIRILDGVLSHLTVDNGLDVDEIRTLFATARSFGSEQMETFDFSSVVRNETIDGNSVLALNKGWESVVDDFLNGRSSDEATTSTTEATTTASTPESEAPAPGQTAAPIASCAAS